MKNFSRFIGLFSLAAAMLFTSSCAMIFNKRDVEVTFKSIPDGADVYVDGDKVGKTPVTTRIKPSKDYGILYIKDGYANREFKIKKIVGNSTLRPTSEYSMCVIDAIGSVLIVPMISVFSNSCAQFDSTTYSKALDKGARLNVISQNVE
jgi:hypothetical protein